MQNEAEYEAEFIALSLLFNLAHYWMIVPGDYKSLWGLFCSEIPPVAQYPTSSKTEFQMY